MTEKIITGFLLLGSTMYLFFAHQLSFGTLPLAKAGFFPTLLGIIAVLLGLVLFFKRFSAIQTTRHHKIDWTKFIFLTIGLLFYIMIFNIIGYFMATFIFLFYLFKIADTTGWFIPFLMAISSSTVFCLIFKYFLEVTLP